MNNTNDVVDRLLAGELSAEYALKLFTSIRGFTIQEIQQNAEETFTNLSNTILQIQNEENTDKYILECIILSMFDEYCTEQLYTVCDCFSQYVNLKHIRIIDCDVTDSMLQIICTYFTDESKVKCNLELIDVGLNQLRDEGIKTLSETLIPFHCKSMKNIMCASNYMTDVGIGYLSKAVALCDNLEFIDISQQQSEDDSEYYSPIRNSLPLLSALIGKRNLKCIELFDCGLIPHGDKCEVPETPKLIEESKEIFKNLLTSTPKLYVLQLGRTNLNHPQILQNLMDAFIVRGKWICKRKCEMELFPIFQECAITEGVTLNIVEIIKLYIFDFYDDRFHLLLSQNFNNADVMLPILTQTMSSKYFCIGKLDMYGSAFTFEDVAEIARAIIKNPTMYSVNFSIVRCENGDELDWN